MFGESYVAMNESEVKQLMEVYIKIPQNKQLLSKKATTCQKLNETEQTPIERD